MVTNFMMTLGENDLRFQLFFRWVLRKRRLQWIRLCTYLWRQGWRLDASRRCSLGVSLSLFLSPPLSLFAIYPRYIFSETYKVISFCYRMFITSCKRLRIMKGSEARGLGCGVWENSLYQQHKIKKKTEDLSLSHGEKNLSAWVLEGDFWIWFSFSSIGSLVRKSIDWESLEGKQMIQKVELHFLCSEVWLQKIYLVVWESVMLLFFAIIPIKPKLDTRICCFKCNFCKKKLKNKSQKGCGHPSFG